MQLEFEGHDAGPEDRGRDRRHPLAAECRGHRQCAAFGAADESAEGAHALGTPFVSGTTTQGNCTEAATPRCTLGNLAAGASATARWVVHTRGNGSFTTQAAASTTRQQTSTGNNTASQTSVVTRR